MADNNPPAFTELHSRGHLELLDVIDELRALGLSTILPLPQIIVCGDQSSGKSSVLEAISTVPFPKKDNLCTRFATEVILRRNAEEGQIAVSIIPSHSRSETDRKHLLDFGRKVQDVSELPQLIEDSQKAMGLGSLGNAFSSDILRLEISGPTMPQLTIVDLPGLIHSENQNQSAQDVELVAKLVKSYMRQDRSVILAIVSAKNDSANQIVLKRAREVDPQGLRTLGIITKPDTLHPGSNSEISFLNLARNQDVVFKLGWHVVRNIDSNIEAFDQDRRQLQEQEFFEKSNWKSLDHSMLGVQALRSRLSDILFGQIKRDLPNLIREIREETISSETLLYRLGRSRVSEEEQRHHLFEVSQDFQRLCLNGVHGNYENSFFGDAMKSSDTRRIRAVVQNQNIEFEELIREHGAEWKITDSGKGEGNLTRKEAINRVELLIKKSRGRELPGTFNPILIGELFREYSKPWDRLGQKHVRAVWAKAKEFIDFVLQETADEDVADALRMRLFDNAMKNRLQMAEKRLNTLLEERKYHAITYNHYYSDTATKLTNDRQMRDIKEKLSKCFEERESIDVSMIDWMLQRLVPTIDPNMTRLAAENILDNMQAYYKTARKRFVDDVAVQVIETEIVTQLASIFDPATVYKLDSNTVSLIAGESKSKRDRREQLQSKLALLKASEDTCQKYSRDFAGFKDEIAGYESDLANSAHESTHSFNGSANNSRIPSPEPPATSADARLATANQSLGWKKGKGYLWGRLIDETLENEGEEPPVLEEPQPAAESEGPLVDGMSDFGVFASSSTRKKKTKRGL